MKIIQKTQIYCTLTIDGSLLNAHYFGAKKKKKNETKNGGRIIYVLFQIGNISIKYRN